MEEGHFVANPSPKRYPGIPDWLGAGFFVGGEFRRARSEEKKPPFIKITGMNPMAWRSRRRYGRQIQPNIIMTNPHHKGARTLLRGKGVGTLTMADVERRARELALIEGRDHVLADDLARAKLELQGGGVPDAVSDDADASGSLSRDPSDPAGNRGKMLPEMEADEEGDLEHLALEGVEEAQHEQMLQSRLADERDQDREADASK
ncbi:hypothetical protein K0B96_04160 [Horticoccus luteus]|uniref:Uncharacterized protein n=1 Tax=Horticoccus luteus TaxID=2862869 RepID=A0A8F9XH11_9BACT|nr:hypothetical protein [Horticoccus luteus]QYM79822.1 hypothetical protein K0B96_04160 [Horticoccus luteus]